MNNLTIINQNGKLLADSREVAEIIGKRHSDLLETIKGYVEHLTNGNFRSLDFFLPGTYEDGKGQQRPCYLLTRKGCDLVANKMTGEKGVLFTATYAIKFQDMEEEIKCRTDTLNPSLQIFNQLFQAVLTNQLEINNIKQQIREFCHSDLKLEVQEETIVPKLELHDVAKTKFMGIKQASIETGIAEHTLRLWCKQKKIRFNIAGNTRHILRTDWLEEDMDNMAKENMRAESKNDSYGTLRKIKI